MGKILDAKQRKELLDELKVERARKYAERIKVILLLDDGETHRDISKFLFLNEGTIRNYRKRYKEGGLEQLINDYYHGRSCFLTDKELEVLTADLQSRIFPTTQAVIDHVLSKFQVNYSRGGMTDLLHRIGFSFKKATPVPGKANKEKQRKFVNQYNGFKAHGPVYFGDATHPEFTPTIGYGWIKRGENFDVMTNSGFRKRVNILGLIGMDCHDVIARSFPTINKDAVCEALKLVRKKHPREQKIYVVLDGASYNKAKKVRNLAKQLNIEIRILPPYSPNLNPIERLWKFMKKKVTLNRHFEEFDDFKKNLMEFFRTIRKNKSELATLINDNFPIIGT